LEVSNENISIGQEVVFSGIESFDRDGGLIYFFDFGDGTSIKRTVDPIGKHTYRDMGTYKVNLRVVDRNGITSGLYFVTISVVNIPPTGTISSDRQTTYSFENITFRFNVSDPDGGGTKIAVYVDNFLFDVSQQKSGIMEIYFARPGIHIVEASVTDDEGGTTVLGPIHIIVENRKPIAILSATVLRVNTSVPVTLSSIGTKDMDGSIVRWIWNLGDGTVYESEYQDGDPAHIYWNPGIYRVTLTVFDDLGALNSSTVTIIVEDGQTAEHDSGGIWTLISLVEAVIGPIVFGLFLLIIPMVFVLTRRSAEEVRMLKEMMSEVELNDHRIRTKYEKVHEPIDLDEMIYGLPLARSLPKEKRY
jgi:PKD repeat protein